MPKHKSSRNKYVLVAVFLFAVVVVSAIVVSITQSRKPLASEYFTITHTGSIGTFRDNTTVTLKILGLSITAVGGDATNPQLLCDSQAYPIDDVYNNNATNGVLAKGESWDHQIELTGGDYQTHGLTVYLNNENMFEVEIQIGSKECEIGTIIVAIDPESIVGVG
jgi:hypothetical protein